jgi:hypothetical protein
VRASSARERVRLTLAQDVASGPIAAVPLRVEHAHARRFGTRLVSLAWTLDDQPVASREWPPDDGGAPELQGTFVDVLVSPGEHELAVTAAYSVYSCCYACGYFQRVTLRLAHEFVAGPHQAVALCLETGGGSVLAPIEESLAPRIVPCTD